MYYFLTDSVSCILLFFPGITLKTVKMINNVFFLVGGMIKERLTRERKKKKVTKKNNNKENHYESKFIGK